MSGETIRVPDAEAMVALGERMGRAWATAPTPSGLVYLEGGLGVGKTTLARGILAGLGFAGPVRSPTYTLVEPYERDGVWVNHLDLYRIEAPEELELLGARDLFGGDALNLVEWPERGAGWLPAPDLQIGIEMAGGARRLRAQAVTALGRRLGSGWAHVTP